MVGGGGGGGGGGGADAAPGDIPVNIFLWIFCEYFYSMKILFEHPYNPSKMLGCPHAHFSLCSICCFLNLHKSAKVANFCDHVNPP